MPCPRANLDEEMIKTRCSKSWMRRDLNIFSKNVVPTGDDRALYDLLPSDSQVENEFVQGLEARDDVKRDLKLPHWVTVVNQVRAKAAW